MFNFLAELDILDSFISHTCTLYSRTIWNVIMLMFLYLPLFTTIVAMYLTIADKYLYSFVLIKSILINDFVVWLLNKIIDNRMDDWPKSVCYVDETGRISSQAAVLWLVTVYVIMYRRLSGIHKYHTWVGGCFDNSKTLAYVFVGTWAQVYFEFHTPRELVIACVIGAFNGFMSATTVLYYVKPRLSHPWVQWYLSLTGKCKTHIDNESLLVESSEWQSTAIKYTEEHSNEHNEDNIGTIYKPITKQPKPTTDKQLLTQRNPVAVSSAAPNSNIHALLKQLTHDRQVNVPMSNMSETI